MSKISHYIYGVCGDCCVRNCKKTPKEAKVTGHYTCDKYRKRVEGWKFKEVYRGVEILMGRDES